MTIDDARNELEAIAVDPRADFAHQDYVDEALSAARQVTMSSRLRRRSRSPAALSACDVTEAAWLSPRRHSSRLPPTTASDSIR